MRTVRFLLPLVLGALLGGGALAKKPEKAPEKTAAKKEKAPAAPRTAAAVLKDAKGQQVGTATLTETPHGVLIDAKLTKVPEGTHAFHIHAVGKCDPPDFTSAGGHFNPGGKHHGLENPHGMHAGDLTNVTVPAGGVAEVQQLAPGVSLKPGARNNLLDKDGSALVLHAVADDYKTDPAGNAGGRIACGVIEKK